MSAQAASAHRQARPDWFYWLIAAFAGLQLLWGAAVIFDFFTHPWAPDLGGGSPLGRLLTVLGVVPLTVGTALLVLRRTPGNVVGLCLLLWGTSIIGETLRLDSPLLPYHGLNTGWLGLWFLPLFFPDGRPQPRRLAGLICVWCALAILQIPMGLLVSRAQDSGGRADLPNALFVPALGWLKPASLLLFGALLIPIVLLIVPSLITRYRTSDSRARQQLKWMAWSFAVLVVSVVPLRLAGINSNTPVELSPAKQMVENVIGLAMTLFPTLTIGHAILRHRLYDIDLIIRRTLVYSVLSVLLALAYLGSILLLQSVFGQLTGNAESPLITVLSTLAIAALFFPLRTRVQAFIDRRFYRRKYDAARTLATFAATARDETDLGQLAERLVGVVDETMQPTSAGLWLRAQGRASPAGQPAGSQRHD